MANWRDKSEELSCSQENKIKLFRNTLSELEKTLDREAKDLMQKWLKPLKECGIETPFEIERRMKGKANFFLSNF